MPRPRGRKTAAPSAAEQKEPEVHTLPFPRGLMEAELNTFKSAMEGRVPPPTMLTPETLRYMAERSHIFQAILRRRTLQVAQFAKRPLFDGDMGFRVVPKEARHSPTPAEAREARRIEKMLLGTGVVYNPARQDTLRTALQKLVWNTYVYDAMVVEPVFDARGRLLEWYVLDGGTIQRTNPSIYQPQTPEGKLSAPISYVQVLNEQVVAEWAADELIYVVRNPSPYIHRYGYGQPELELLLTPITIEIEILTWANALLQNSSVPEGLLILKSARKELPNFFAGGSAQTWEDLIRKARQELAGAQNAGRIAVLQIPPGDDATYIQEDLKNREMPFAGLFELVQNIICAYMGISPAELDIVKGAMRKGSSLVQSEARASELRYSRQNGLVSLLGALGDVLNRLVEMENPEFTVMWEGVDHTSEEERHNLEAAMLRSGSLTLNEARAMQNREPYSEWWGDLPLVPQVLSIEASRRGIPGFGNRTLRFNGASPAKPGVSGQPGSRVRGEPPEPSV